MGLRGLKSTAARRGAASGGSRRRISGSSHELFVRQDGPVTGAPVTLIHGFPTSSFQYRELIPRLKAEGGTDIVVYELSNLVP